MTETHVATELARLDAVIAALPRGQLSLSPSRKAATPLTVLYELEPDVSRRGAFGEVLAKIATATLEHFPENIFWDFDFLAQGLADSEPSERQSAADWVVALNRRFGRTSVIGFRYAHDFLYGYDWARWVRKQPQARGSVGPFTETFLKSMDARGGELEALIDANDAKYPQLPVGLARNPFEFSREPKDEHGLFVLLAQRGHVPVPAWERRATLNFRRGYTELREQAARELGLAREAPATGAPPTNAR